MLSFWMKRKRRLFGTEGTYISKAHKLGKEQSLSSMKRQKKEQSQALQIFEPLMGVLHRRVKLGLANPIKDVVAPWAYLVQQEGRKWSRPEEQLCRKRDGRHGLSRKGGGSSAYQLSAGLMPTLKCSLSFPKCQLCKRAFLQLSYSPAVAGSAAFVLFMSFYVTSYNIVREKKKGKHLITGK